MRSLIYTPPAKTAPLARAAFAKTRAFIANQTPEAVAETMRGGKDVLRVINRAPVEPASTTDDGGGAELMRTDYGDYLAWLAPESAAARLISLGLNVPMRGHEFKAPGRNTAPIALPWVGEANPIPVRSFSTQGVTLSPRKMAAISVITREAARYGGEAVITAMLREDGAQSLDAGYFSTDAGDSEKHAGLLAALSPISGYPGGDKVAFESDIAALLSVVAPNGSGKIVFVTGQLTAQRIALFFPDFKSPVFASQAVADTRLIAVDAGALVHSAGDFGIDVAYDAALHLENEDPQAIVAEGSPGVLAAPVRSLHQTDSLGVRITGEVAFAGRKANVAAYLDNPTW